MTTPGTSSCTKCDTATRMAFVFHARQTDYLRTFFRRELRRLPDGRVSCWGHVYHPYRDKLAQMVEMDFSEYEVETVVAGRPGDCVGVAPGRAGQPAGNRLGLSQLDPLSSLAAVVCTVGLPPVPGREVRRSAPSELRRLR